MIMCSYRKIAVTAQKLSKYPLPEQIERVAKCNKPDILILREKELSESEYEDLARQVLLVCKKEKIECILHTFIDIAKKLQIKKIHLPLPVLKKRAKELGDFDMIGVSVHSKEEALEAVRLGATYLIAGNVFETDCKKGLSGKGVDFLKEICENSSVPVYGIGGINDENTKMVQETGAMGECRMSYYMKL